MKKELKLIYNNVVKPIPKIVGNLLIAPLALPYRIRRDVEDEKNNIRDNFAYSAFGCVADLIYLCFSPALIEDCIRSLENGNIGQGLIPLIPLATNVISGAYELYRWAKNKVKAEEDGKLGKLEKALAPSRAKSIEKAVEYMTIESDGSLHTNGNYNDEEREIQYRDIIRRIPKKAVAKMMIKLTENLPSLELSEKEKPGAIEKYFGEKSGVPISNYHELDLFYQVLTEKAEGKRK